MKMTTGAVARRSAEVALVAIVILATSTCVSAWTTASATTTPKATFRFSFKVSELQHLFSSRRSPSVASTPTSTLLKFQPRADVEEEKDAETFEHLKNQKVTAVKDNFTAGEWKTSDPDVKTTAQLLAALWDMITRGSLLDRGEERTTLFPGMAHKLRDREFVEAFMGHLDVCKDVCDNFGIHTLLVPSVGEKGVAGFTVKSYKSDRAYNANEEGDYEFEPDAMWDDENFTPMFDYEALAKEQDEEEGLNADRSNSTASAKEKEEPLPEVDWTEADKKDESMIQTTKDWVSRMMSDMALCPFTSGSEKAGLPMGPVYYTVDRCSGVEQVYAAYWKEVVRVEQASESDLSTTLLILPEFALHNVEAYENVCNTLTQPMETLEMENLLQLVFFHPQWTFRDGAARGGDDSSQSAAANYARRSPWPMINILRTTQVRAAQRGIPTGLVYQQNEKTLSAVGSHDLEVMLRTRDWTALEDRKVNRRDMDALRVAQDYQMDGTLDAQKEFRLDTDATPAVNKVDRDQVEGGDMVNVIRQALGKRLGKTAGADGESAPASSLSGAETSAVMMASDFLIQELDRIADAETS